MRLKIFPAVIGVAISLCVIAIGADAKFWENIKSFSTDFDDYWASGVVSDRLATTFDLLRLRNKWKGPTRANPDFPLLDLQAKHSREPITCALCETMVNSIFGWIDAGDTKEELVDKVVNICLTFNIQTEKVCRGVVDMNADIIMFIYANSDVTASNACGLLLYGDCPLDNPDFEWSVDLAAAGPKPPPQNPELPPEDSSTFKVLHISDFHLDLHYHAGGNADCGEPTCCRAEQGPPATPEATSGYWGDYRDCDMPWHALVDMLQHIRATHPDIAYILYTGDTPDHTVWYTSIENNTETFTRSYEELATVFAGVPVYPILGNHEPHPLNLFVASSPSVPQNISTQWLYTLAKDVWSTWLGPETHADILKGGFYATKALEKLWIVAVNNNFCYNYNFWSLYDNEDPEGQLQWLIETLVRIEALGEKVHLLAHIPSGNANCVNTWTREFNKILDRFEDTIVAQFNGHSHHDEFFIYYDLEDRSRANGVSFIPGSTSEWNPYYRIYTVEGTFDGSFYRILDHDNWYYNLTEANIAGPDVAPNWRKLYSFNEEFGTKAVTPSELDLLVHRMVNDADLKQKYFEYYYSMSDPKLEEGCDEVCQNKLLCKIVRTLDGDTFKCDELFPPQ